MENLKFQDKTETSVKLLWEPPKSSDDDVLYDVECNKCSSGRSSGQCDQPCGDSVTFKPSQKDLEYGNVTVQGLNEGTEYRFVIYSKNNNSLRIERRNWASKEKKIKTEGML